MKLRTAIRKANQVYIIASCSGQHIYFQVSKAEVLRVLGDKVFDEFLDAHLPMSVDDEVESDIWSWDEGLMPLWNGKDLKLRFT